MTIARRIRLDFENTKGGDCDLCGTQGPLVQRYFTLNYGTNYTGAWRHPLSPYQEQDSAEPLPRHPQPGGIGYRHWLGLVYAWQDDKQRIVPARVVDTFLRESEGMGQARIWAFGYDMDNMKPRCWYEAIMPLYHVPNDIRERFTTRIGEMIQAADRVTGMLRTAVKEAWFKRPGDARGNTNFLSDGFYQHTEADFYACLTRLIERIREEQDRSVLAEWHLFLCRAALAHICHPLSYPLVHQWFIFKKSPSGTTRRSFCENGAQWMNLRTPPGCRSMPSAWKIARCCPSGRVALRTCRVCPPGC